MVAKSPKKMKGGKLVPRESTYLGLLSNIAFDMLPKEFQPRSEIAAGRGWVDFGILESKSGAPKLLVEIMIEGIRYTDHRNRTIQYGIEHNLKAWLVNFIFSKPRKIKQQGLTPGLEEVTVFVDTENHETVKVLFADQMKYYGALCALRRKA